MSFSILGIPILLAGILSFSHFDRGLFQDEINTLNNYATGDLKDALTKYIPNNHVLLSVTLSLWRGLWGPEVELWQYRLLPWLVFLLSTGFLTYYAYRLFDRPTAFLAGVLFAGSHVVLNYSLSLRGYAFSWPFVVISLGEFLSFLKNRRRMSLVVYGLSGLCCIGILPTNVVIYAGFMGGFALCSWLRKIPLEVNFLILLLPFFGFFWYLGLIDEMVYFLQTNSIEKYTTSVFELLVAWGYSFGKDFHLLILIAAYVFVKSLYLSYKTKHALSDLKILAGALLPVLLAYLVLMPVTPYPRTLIPLLPIVCLCIAVLVVEWIKTIKINLKTAYIVSVVMMTLAVQHEFWGDNLIDKYGGEYIFIADYIDQGLYYPYYTQDFYPHKALEKMRLLSNEQPTIFFWNYLDIPAINYVAGVEGLNWTQGNLRVYNPYYLNNLSLDLGDQGRVLLLAENRARAWEIVNHLNLPMVPSWEPQVVVDTGFYKIYDCQLTQQSFQVISKTVPHP